MSAETPRPLTAEGWPEIWSELIVRARIEECTPEFLLWQKLDACRAELAEARAENARLRAALEAAATSGYCPTSRKHCCPMCGRHPDENHDRDCAIGRALAGEQEGGKE